ncbi:MAG: thioesterase family protein [Ilumatobacteraceae bacterium]
MTFVAVTGGGRRAAEWATRFLASGLDVVVDDSTLCDAVVALWPQAQRMGLFPGSDLGRLNVAGGLDALTAAAVVQVVDGTPPAGATGLVATDTTARACSPVHLLPIVEVSGPDHVALGDFYRSIGMTPVGPEAGAHERRQLGEGLVELTDGGPDALIAVMRSLRASGKGAGKAMAHHEASRFAAGAIAPWQPGDAVSAPLALYRTPVEPDWVDYNGHMSEAAYLTAAGWASDALFRYIGDDEAYRAAGHSFYTVETHIHYLQEVDVHEPITFTTQVLGVDGKRLHFVHTMYHGDTGATLCTAEQMLVHVDMHAGRSVPILPHVAAALAAIAEAHSGLPIPSQVGSVMRLPAPRA